MNEQKKEGLSDYQEHKLDAKVEADARGAKDSNLRAEQGAGGNVEMVDVSVQVPKQLNDFANALGDLVGSVKKALDDGFQPGQDIPVIIGESVGKLADIAKNVSGIAPAFQQNPLASGIVVANALAKVLK